jgi:dihydrofolate reductase
MRKFIVYIATSADGYIARRDGGIDWLDRPRPRDHYGIGAFMRSIDTVVWGRKTYDMALGMGGSGGGFDRSVRNYVFSRHPPASPPTGVEFVTEPVAEFARRLRVAPGKSVWMMGGAGIIASFLDVGEIDEFIIHVIPVLIGEGIPLLAPRRRTVPLALKSTKRYSDGVVRLHYAEPRRASTDAARSTFRLRRTLPSRRHEPA